VKIAKNSLLAFASRGTDGISFFLEASQGVFVLGSREADGFAPELRLTVCQ